MEVERWLKRFMNMANQAGWDNKMRCDMFEFKMADQASYWYSALPWDVQKSWSRLSHAFTSTYPFVPNAPVTASVTFSDCSREEDDRRQPRTYVPVEAIPTFTRGSGPTAEAWLKKYLYVANQAGWDNKMRCETFEFKMEGHASYWYTALPSGVQKNWGKLVQAFKNNYSVGLQSPQERYWSATREDKESVLDYLVRLNALGKRAGIDYHGYSSAEHVRRYLSTVRDNKLSDRFLPLGITGIKTLEQRLRDFELGQ